MSASHGNVELVWQVFVDGVPDGLLEPMRATSPETELIIVR